MNKNPSHLLIGAHNSIQGGLNNAVLEAEAIGASTMQIFTANQKRWEGKKISEEQKELWFEALEKYPLDKIMSHDSYLINLGSCKEDILVKSRKAFKEEIKRCHELKLSFLNFHPGAATESSREECLDMIITSLLEMESLVHQGSTRLLFETTAGQGTAVGYIFEEIGYLISHLHSKIPIGVCIDTCHIFAAGYDITSSEGWDLTLEAFEKEIGLKHLYALHVNDSLKPLGSRKDRHAPLGQGEIGIECFKVMMNHPKLKDLPKYLETPDGPPLWKQEIAMLRTFAHDDSN